MRRKDQEITTHSAIEEVVEKAMVCRLAMLDGEWPYVVPLCFGYRQRVLYVHGALKGKKIEALKNNPNVCVEFDIVSQVIPADQACDFDMKYQSVIGFGTATFVEDAAEKQAALDLIVARYSLDKFQYPRNMVNATAVIKIDLDRMSGKRSGTGF